MKVTSDKALIEEYLKKHEIQKIFSNPELFLSGFKIFTYDKNELLLPDAESRKYLFFLMDGKFSVYASDADGNQFLVRYCDSFIVMGDMELMGYAEASHSVEMNSKCTFLALETTPYKSALLKDPVFMYYIAKVLAEKLNYIGSSNFFDKSLSSKQKIVSRIIAIAGESLFYKENIRKAATILSISYRHYHRILSDLVERQLLKRENGGYRILDISALETVYFESSLD